MSFHFNLFISIGIFNLEWKLVIGSGNNIHFSYVKFKIFNRTTVYWFIKFFNSSININNWFIGDFLNVWDARLWSGIRFESNSLNSMIGVSEDKETTITFTSLVLQSSSHNNFCSIFFFFKVLQIWEDNIVLSVALDQWEISPISIFLALN